MKKAPWPGLSFTWCPRWDSNPHELPQRFLRPPRLPFRHSGARDVPNQCNRYIEAHEGIEPNEALDRKRTAKEKGRPMDAKLSELLNHQINEELYSAYLYLIFADYYEDRGLKGFANWYMVQVQEEVAHAKILRRYLLDNDVSVKMTAIAEPDKTFSTDLEPLEAGLAHEKHITACIDRCYAAANDVHDFRAMQMLDWFVKEQGEEETNASDMIKNMKLFGSDPKGLYDLDREYQTRVFVAPTMPM